MKSFLYSVCFFHVVWRVARRVSKMMIYRIQLYFEMKDRENQISRKMNRYWKSYGFKNQVDKANEIKIYRDIYAKAEYALLDFKGNKSNVKKRKKIR